MAQRDLLASGPTKENVVPILYRPFDIRYTYYTGWSRGFLCMPRSEVMRHILAGDNLALCVGRQGHVVGAGEWNLIYCSQRIEDLNLFYRGGNANFPLYLYPTADRADLFARHEASERQPNLNPEWVAALTEAHGQAPSPEEIFHYIYAILHAPTYREKYAEFLRTDFPRIPFTGGRKLFANIAALGTRLADLHLLKSPALDPPACRFEGQGDAIVARTKAQGFHYDAEEQRMYINKTQYFGPVPPEVYEYQVGGYQVCDKWLKDRKERHLELDDIRTYCRLATAVGLTLMLQKRMDGLYLKVEENLLPSVAE